MRVLWAAVGLLTLILAGTASGQLFVWFLGSGSGDLYARAPVFAGTMDDGGDIVDGEWFISIDDSEWPPDTEPSARRQYLHATFFEENYTPGTPGFWSGYFDVAHGLSDPCQFYVEDFADGSTLWGSCSFHMTVIDNDGNAVLDGWDGCQGGLTGHVTITGGTGAYTGLEGEGSWWASYARGCPEGTSQAWDIAVYLWLDGPGLPVQPQSWGGIKALYR
jgi:hypothetical protein